VTNQTSAELSTDLLTQVVRLLGILVTKGLPKDQMTQGEQILLLSSAGMHPKEIADLLGTTAGTVSVRLSEAKKKAGVKEKKKNA